MNEKLMVSIFACFCAATIILPFITVFYDHSWCLIAAWAISGFTCFMLISGGIGMIKKPPSTPIEYRLLYGVEHKTYRFGDSKMANQERDISSERGTGLNLGVSFFICLAEFRDIP